MSALPENGPYAYQDDSGDLYCETHREWAGADAARFTVEEMRTWQLHPADTRGPHCDFCGHEFLRASREA